MDIPTSRDKINGFLARLGFAGARGRYLYVSGLFCLILLCLSWLYQTDVQTLIERGVTDVNKLAGAAGSISTFLWLPSIAGIGMLGIGFLLLEYTLRLPVTRIVRALKAETQDMQEISVSTTSTTEIKDLSHALNDMRSKLHRYRHDSEILLEESHSAVLRVDKNGIVTTRNSRTGKFLAVKERNWMDFASISLCATYFSSKRIKTASSLRCSTRFIAMEADMKL